MHAPSRNATSPLKGIQLNARSLGAASVALTLLSLAVWRVPAYDPTAWLIWGDQLTGGTLIMEGGPSWKPLPVAFTVAFAFAGDTLAPWLWLVVARLSGFAAIGLVFLLARRLGGARAGLIAAAGLALATDFLFNCFRGDSEGLLVAFVAGALLLQLGGRHRLAFGALILAAGVRPEVWPLLAAHGLWLVWRERRLVALLAVGAGGAFVLAAWFLPDYLATGDWRRGAGRAQYPVAGSPAQSAFPFGMTLVFAAAFLTWPLYAGAALAVRDARARPRSPADRALLLIAGMAASLMLVVAVMAELGFTGNIRYATLPGALACVLGGVGMERFASLVRGRAHPRVACAVGAAALIAVLISAGIVVNGAIRLSHEERVMGAGLREALRIAGDDAAIRACGRVSTTPFERQMVARRLQLPQRDVSTRAVAPGVMFVRRGQPGRDAQILPIRARTDDWVIRSTCPLP